MGSGLDFLAGGPLPSTSSSAASPSSSKSSKSSTSGRSMAEAFWRAATARGDSSGRRLAGNDSDSKLIPKNAGTNDGRLDANSREIVHREQVGIHSFFMLVPRSLHPRRLRPRGATSLIHAFYCSDGRTTARTVTATTVNAFMKKSWFAAAGDALCHEVSKNHALVSKLPGVADLRPGGLVSGPFQFALADIGMWFATFGAYERIEPMALTSEMSIRFLRPAVVADGARVWARIDVNSVGRKTMVSTATIYTDDPTRPTAVAQGTFIVPPP